MPVTPGASTARATKKISVTRPVLVQKAVPKGLVPAKPLPGSYGMPFNPFGLPQPPWPVPVSRPATLSTAAAVRLVPEGHGTSTPVHAEAAVTENDEETLAEGAAVEMDTDAPNSSDSEEDIPRRKRVRIVSPATEPAILTLTPRVAIAPMSSTTTVKTPSLPPSKRTASRNPSAAPSSKRNAARSLPAASSPKKRNAPRNPPPAPSSSKRHASRAPPAAPSPRRPKPAPQLRKKVDTRTAQQKRKDSTLPTGKLAFRKHFAAAAAAATANPFPGSAPTKPLTPPQASSSGAATATAAPSSPGLRGRQDEDDFKTVVIKEMLQRRVDRNIDPPAEDFLD